MAFKKMPKQTYPPRLWALIGYPGSGKSTFATQMKTPILPIDADHRFTEVAHLVKGDVFALSDTPNDNNRTDVIADLLDQNMPGTGIATITVDSLTAIVAPLVMKAFRDNEAGLNKNKAAAYADKATAMRQLQFAVNKWGCDVLWIYHLQDGRDQNAKEVTTATLSKTERNRLHSSLNMELHVVQDGNKRGIKIVWARRGRYGMTLWDDSGYWVRMPDRIEQAVYDGLTEADQERIATEPPDTFPTPAAAIDWGLKQGVFDDLHHAQNAYDKLKREYRPASAREMRDLWVNDVRERRELAAREAEAAAPDEPAPAIPDQGELF